METFNVTYLHHTDRAVCVDCDGEELWLPLSQIEIEDVDQLTRGEEVDVEVPIWLARAKGMMT